MGITSLNKLLKRYCGDAFFPLPITAFKGKRISIDAGFWMYTHMATARKEVIKKTNIAAGEPNIIEIRRVWFQHAVDFILGWLGNDVTPVFVFDGKSHPEKSNTKTERHDKRIAARAKIDALYAQLRGDILQQSPTIIDLLRKELTNFNDIPHEEYELFKNVIKAIGVPCIQAQHDAEQLCASLCIEGKVAAVFSKDTDNLVLGCPLMITEFSKTSSSYDEFGHRVGHVECVRLDCVLSGLQLTQNEFVDMCIMCGCDFNENMPQVAVMTSYDLIKQWHCIEKLPSRYDTRCLKYERCREIFGYKTSTELSVQVQLEEDNEKSSSSETLQTLHTRRDVNTLNVDRNAITKARDYLELAGVSGKIQNLIHYYSILQEPADGLVESLQLTAIGPYVPPVKPVIMPQPKKLVLVIKPPGTNINNTNTVLDNSESSHPVIKAPLSSINDTISRINTFELPSEALMLVSNFFEEINKEGLDSNLTVPILNYYALLGVLSTELTTLPTMLQPINKLLIAHGWTNSGFVAAPNRQELVKDLNFLLNTR